MTLATNRGAFSDKAPSAYLRAIENDGVPRERLDEFLAGQVIPPDALRRDDFDGFIAARQKTLGEAHSARARTPRR